MDVLEFYSRSEQEVNGLSGYPISTSFPVIINVYQEHIQYTKYNYENQGPYSQI
jgi:hypothetical protein